MRVKEAGDQFGEIALLNGGRRTADVVALTRTTLLRLAKADYLRYLAQLAEVEQELHRAAAARDGTGKP